MTEPFDYQAELPAINEAVKQTAIEWRAKRGSGPIVWPAGAQNRPTPETTVDAIMHCVKVRGVAALKEPANVERLSRCDQEAHAEIKRRIAKLRVPA